jgi:hypothetical protein
MAERKQTPDILAEILSGAPSEPPQIARPAEKATSRPKKAAAPAAPKAARGRWEYRVASFQQYHGCRLRFIDGVEHNNWAHAPLMHQYLAQMAQEGWELVAACAGERLFGVNDKHQLFFRRPAG